MNDKNTSINNQEEPDYSLPGDCNNCREPAGCYLLIGSPVQDILTLEEEMVRWRQALLKHLPPLDAQNLLADIFGNLARRNYDNEAYQPYLKVFGYAEDPMETDGHTRLLWRLRNGMDETSVNL